MAFDLLSEISNSQETWALKSQTAALIAEVFFLYLLFEVKRVSLFSIIHNSFLFQIQIVRRGGLDLWQELFPSLVSLSSKGPAEVYSSNVTLFVFFILFVYYSMLKL